MIKQRFYPILLLLCATLLSSCAGVYLKNGKLAYEQLMYQDAISNLEKGTAKKPNTESILLLADAYMKTNNFVRAKQMYDQASIDPAITDDQRIDFGRALMSNEQYDDAREVFEGVLSRTPSHEVAQNLMLSCKNIETLKADSALFKVDQIMIPNAATAFSAVNFEEGILFSSTSDDGAKDPYTGTSYLDLYYSKNEVGNWASPVKLENVNGKYHDGIASVSEDGSTMIITRSNYMSKSRLGTNDNATNNTQLYSSTKDEEGKWSAPELLPFCNADQMYAHPALSNDSKIMYFSSDLPGGSGGMDLHKVSYDGTTWSVPSNLGESINTAGDEVFPSLRGNDSLFFSSDAMTSIGGLDILFSVNRDGNWTKAEHLSYPINSASDDFGISFNEGGESGMLSSDRHGTDRLYNFLMFNPEIAIDGLITDVDELKPLDGVTITIENLTDGTLKILTSDNNGKFAYDLLPGKEYKIRAERDDYLDLTETISTMGKTSSETINVIMEMRKLIIGDGDDPFDPNGQGEGNGDGDGTGNDAVYEIPNIHWDYNKWEIRADAVPYLDQAVKTLKDNTDLKVQIQSHCDCRGSHHFNDQLSKKRANSVLDYLVSKGIPRKLVKSKGFGERRLLNKCKDGAECSENEHQVNRRTEFVITEKLK